MTFHQWALRLFPFIEPDPIILILSDIGTLLCNHKANTIDFSPSKYPVVVSLSAKSIFGGCYILYVLTLSCNRRRLDVDLTKKSHSQSSQWPGWGQLPRGSIWDIIGNLKVPDDVPFASVRRPRRRIHVYSMLMNQQAWWIGKFQRWIDVDSMLKNTLSAQILFDVESTSIQRKKIHLIAW